MEETKFYQALGAILYFHGVDEEKVRAVAKYREGEDLDSLIHALGLVWLERGISAREKIERTGIKLAEIVEIDRNISVRHYGRLTRVI